MSDTVSANLFQNLILMVLDNYKVDSSEKLRLLQVGVTQYTQYIFLQDKLVDDDVNWLQEYKSDDNVLLSLNFLLRGATINLNSVFEISHPFWKYLYKEESVYYNFIIKEKIQNSSKSEISQSEFEEMAFAKHCLSLVPMRALEWLFVSRIHYTDIKKLFFPIFNGIQMMDDIDDFTKDLQSGQWNLIQYEVQKAIDDENLIDDGTLDHFNQRVFYASGICLKYSNFVLEEYQKALIISKDLQLFGIQDWITNMIEEIKQSILHVKYIME